MYRRVCLVAVRLLFAKRDSKKRVATKKQRLMKLDERAVVLCSMKDFVWETVSKIKEVVVLDVVGVG
jgi:hypothetical protein